MPPREPDNPTDDATPVEYQRLSQALTELHEGIRRLRVMGDDQEVTISQGHQDKLETYVDLWEPSIGDLDDAENEYEAISRSLTRAYCLALWRERRLPWLRDALSLRNDYQGYVEAYGMR